MREETAPAGCASHGTCACSCGTCKSGGGFHCERHSASCHMSCVA